MQAHDKDDEMILKGVQFLFNIKYDLSKGYKLMQKLYANPNPKKVERVMKEVYKEN